MRMNPKQIWEEDTFAEIKEKTVEANKAYWFNKKTVTQGDEWIYVYHGMSEAHFDWAVHENIIAKGLQEKINLPIASVIDGSGRVLPAGLDESFGIADSVHLFYSQYINEQAGKKILETARAFAKATYKDKDKLLQLEYRGIRLGDALYDYLLLKNWQYDVLSFECFDISMEQYTDYIRDALSMIDHTFEFFSQRRPAYVITTEKLQLKRLFGDIARTFGAKEIIVLTNWPEGLVQISSEGEPAKRVLLSDCIRGAIEHHMGTSKVRPEKADDLFVMESQAQSAAHDLRAQLGILNQNRNVFIFPHAFIDVPRETYDLYFHHDYLEWFLKTIETIKQIPEVNWIIKDHPMTGYYKQNDYIRKVFMENKTPNMYWCDSNVSGNGIKEIADCVVTCGGEAALEYWAYGVPTVTTAKTFFSHEGISYNLKSREEYEHTLRNIAMLAKPSEESAAKAQTILTAMKQMSSGSGQDDLANLFANTRKMQRASYRNGRSFRHIQSFCEGYLELLRRKAIEDSCIYQLKNICDISIAGS